MPDWLRPVLDPYDRKARLRPALLCGMPLIASVVLLLPEFGAIWGSLGGVVIYCGGSALLIQLGRDRGQELQVQLYQSWGGKPSVAMLRYSDRRLDRPTKERYRRFLSSAVPGLQLASPEEEERHPEQADEGYESANAWLLARSRNHECFGLLFKENMNYGFRRNLLALKSIAYGVEAIAVLILIGVALASWTGNLATTFQSLALEWWASLTITAVHALLFVACIRPEWVRAAAENYARQLLAACDLLGGALDKKS